MFVTPDVDLQPNNSPRRCDDASAQCLAKLDASRADPASRAEHEKRFTHLEPAVAARISVMSWPDPFHQWLVSQGVLQ